MTESDEPFWKFSLAFYGRPEVPAACLALQDAHGHDVNLLLYACWIGLSGRGRLAPADLARAAATSEPWHRGVIEPLRAARRALKEAGAAAQRLYVAAKAVELDGERMAQQRLAALAPPAGTRAADVCIADGAANLALCLRNATERQLAAPIFAALDAAAVEDGSVVVM
ncbi:MAG TPA: TIGR02444 family protein [Stellaceae bacterium]|nr:TIGR02444 family protein [Stellaceae bacterium]